MAKVITQHESNLLYGKLFSLHERTKELRSMQDSLDKPLYIIRIKELQKFFEEIIGKVTQDAAAKSSTFSRIDFLAEKYGLKDISGQLHQTRIHCNHARHYETDFILKSEEQYNECIEAIAVLINRCSEMPILEHVLNIYNRPGKKIAEPIVKIERKKIEKEETALEDKDLERYPNVRLPICILLDESGSMNVGTRIKDINAGIKLLSKIFIENEVTQNAVELEIITFGHEVKEIIKFARLEKQKANFDTLEIKPVGHATKIGEAVMAGLRAIESRKNKYKEFGIDYWQPWLFIITDSDGSSMDNYLDSAKHTKELESQKKPKLVVFPILVGNGDEKILNEFSNKREPYKLIDADIKAFFYWIFKEAEYISKSSFGGEEKVGAIPKKFKEEFSKI